MWDIKNTIMGFCESRLYALYASEQSGCGFELENLSFISISSYGLRTVRS